MSENWQEYAYHMLETDRYLTESEERKRGSRQIARFYDLLQQTLGADAASRQAYDAMVAGRAVEMGKDQPQLALDGFTLFMVESDDSITLFRDDSMQKFPIFFEVWGEVENCSPIKVNGWADIGRLLGMVATRKVVQEG